MADIHQAQKKLFPFHRMVCDEWKKEGMVDGGSRRRGYMDCRCRVGMGGCLKHHHRVVFVFCRGSAETIKIQFNKVDSSTYK